MQKKLIKNIDFYLSFVLTLKKIEVFFAKKRLFLGAEISSPWIDLPKQGREISPSMRHITLSFFGFVENIPNIPELPFKIGPAGIFNNLLFLPKEKPRVVAYKASFLSGKELETLDITPHVSLARTQNPDITLWEKWFTPQPFFIKAIHLYESFENLQYIPIKSVFLIPPLEPLDHTADIAFRVIGQSLYELYLHAALALAFSFPPMLSYIEQKPVSSLDEVIEALNHLITKADIEIGCPFKAISFQGRLLKTPQSFYEWDMVVDV